MSENKRKLFEQNGSPLSEDERKSLYEKYENFFKEMNEKYPWPTPDLKMEKLKKNHKFHPGDIYKLKDGAQIWIIGLQFWLKYEDDGNQFRNFYIRVDSWAWDNSVVFGHRVEKNLFGMLSFEECEIEVAFESLDLSKCYKKEEMVNPMPFVDYVYTKKEDTE